jgi:hypothetical protein
MRTAILAVLLVALLGVGHAQADPSWGLFGANSGAFTAKPFIGGLDNFSAGFGLGITSFPDAWPVIGGHALALDGFASTESTTCAGGSISIEKVPLPRDWAGIILTGPDKFNLYLKVELFTFNIGGSSTATPAAKTAAAKPKFAPVVSDAPVDIRPVALTTAMRDF